MECSFPTITWDTFSMILLHRSKFTVRPLEALFMKPASPHVDGCHRGSGIETGANLIRLPVVHIRTSFFSGMTAQTPSHTNTHLFSNGATIGKANPSVKEFLSGVFIRN